MILANNYNLCLNINCQGNALTYGWIPEWPKGTDCKSAASCFGGSNPPPPIQSIKRNTRQWYSFFRYIWIFARNCEGTEQLRKVYINYQLRHRNRKNREKAPKDRIKVYEIMKKIRIKQMKTILPCILLSAVIVVIGLLFLRLRGSVHIKPSHTDQITSQITAFRQDNEAWADEMLGDSRFTMKSSGCLVTCIAAAISTETGSEITPGDLNRIFSENHVYDNEGNIQWAAIEKIDGYTAEVFSGVSESEIHQCLASGHYPIVRVRMHGLGNFHYVLIVGTEDGEYICMDPLENSLTKLSRYLDRVYAVRMVSC